MDQYNIYQVDVDEARERHIATFTDETRANEVLARLFARDQDDMSVDYNLRPVPVDPTFEELNLPPTLVEVIAVHLLEAAEVELAVTGKVVMPLWINPSWLQFELRQRGAHVNRSARTLVSVEAAFDDRSGPVVTTVEVEDGVQEAWAAAADAVMSPVKFLEDQDESEASTIAADDSDQDDFGFTESS